LGLGLAFVLLSLVGAEAKPKAVFWWDSHPGFPPREEWRPGDTPTALAKEMVYSNMAARPGSPRHYQRLKALGFDAVGLPGFEGPFQEFDPDSDEASNLDRVQQTRNQRYYIPWAREAGLDVYLNIQFTVSEVEDGFIWAEEPFAKVRRHLRALARFARRTGCAGLIFDFEPYRKPFHRLWDLSLWQERLSLERPAALALLRQRGAEFAGAIAAEWPECVLHVYGIGYGYFAAAPGDFEDTIGYFFAGLAEPQLAGGVHLNMGHTYYRYDPQWVGDTYRLEMLPLLEKAIQVSRTPDEVGQTDSLSAQVGQTVSLPEQEEQAVSLPFVAQTVSLPAHGEQTDSLLYLREKCSIALGSAAIHRWHSGDGMYDRAVYRITPKRYAAHLIALLRHCPQFIWIVGEASFDWTVPEISREVDDDPYHYWGLDVPFADVSERNRRLTETFAQVMQLTDEQIAARYEQLLKEQEAQMEELGRTLPRATVALLSNREAYLEFDNDWDWRIRRFWSIRSYPNLDLERLTADLPQTDVVLTCVSPIWADRADEEFIAQPRALPRPETWRSFVERGGVLVVADLGTNPNASGWLTSLAPELALPGKVAAGCKPNQPAAWWNEEERLLREPYRLRLFTCGHHLDTEEADSKGWTVLAECEHRKPIYLLRRFGQGLVAVLMSSKFQAGFGWEHIVNLVKVVK